MIAASKLGFFPLFADQNTEMLQAIARLANEKEVDAGTQLFLEGDPAKSLFLVEEGSIMLTMTMGAGIEKLEPLGKGEVVGWSSIVKPHVYKLGAHAKQRSRLLVFNGEQLRLLFDQNPSAGYYFMCRLAEVIGDRLVSKYVQIMSLGSGQSVAT
jgi:CRP-like cAMP-binding protein